LLAVIILSKDIDKNFEHTDIFSDPKWSPN